mmetsp:Transcript_18694/g.56533  ORF Transcript_18694/g.56533 Transcript_18694/m.56533 type:complete len:264 (-) Transcript_18694:1238-2029(-)
MSSSGISVHWRRILPFSKGGVFSTLPTSFCSNLRRWPGSACMLRLLLVPAASRPAEAEGTTPPGHLGAPSHCRGGEYRLACSFRFAEDSSSPATFQARFLASLAAAALRSPGCLTARFLRRRLAAPCDLAATFPNAATASASKSSRPSPTLSLASILSIASIADLDSSDAASSSSGTSSSKPPSEASSSAAAASASLASFAALIAAASASRAAFADLLNEALSLTLRLFFLPRLPFLRELARLVLALVVVIMRSEGSPSAGGE